MRVLLVAGAFPPEKCGVGDYTYHLASSLACLDGLEVGVLTGKGYDISCDKGYESDADIFREMNDWRVFSLVRLIRFIKKYSPDVVHIQYPAKGYNGILPSIIPWVAKYFNIATVQTWHEHFSECDVLGWRNLIVCDSLVYVRPDFISKLPVWASFFIKKIPSFFIENESSIPYLKIDEHQKKTLKNKISNAKPIVCFFGFANPNKGVEYIFDIVDPKKYHLVLICDLYDGDNYHKKLLKLINSSEWINSVTVTGYLPASKVGEILSIVDAVIFPFPSGSGDWNTSLKAAELSGCFIVATSENKAVLGYNQDRNIFFTACDQMLTMRDALSQYAGVRIEPKKLSSWIDIAAAHNNIYLGVCGRKVVSR